MHSPMRRWSYFNPPAPCGAGQGRPQRVTGTFPISIHPPRAGRDRAVVLDCDAHRCISIHPPRAGRDEVSTMAIHSAGRFQSTRPVRGGTFGLFDRGLAGAISIHPPRAGRDFHNILHLPGSPISIHPPRAGRDGYSRNDCTHSDYFNPPAPCGAGPGWITAKLTSDFISIHPPRAGRDFAAPPIRGAALSFQSTRPVRGGTSAGALSG